MRPEGSPDWRLPPRGCALDPSQPAADRPPSFPPHAFDPVGAGEVVRLEDGGDLAAALPVLVGFVPRQSLVLVALGGATGRRVGLTARVDLPDPAHAARIAGALA